VVGFLSTAKTFSKFTITSIFLKDGHLYFIRFLIQLPGGIYMLIIFYVDLHLIKQHIEVVRQEYLDGWLPVLNQKLFVDLLKH